MPHEAEVETSSPFAPDALAGRRVLVTGGTRGIGRATALYLARHGAQVVVTSRSERSAEEAASELRAAGFGAWGYALDVAEVASVAALADALWSDVGGIDVLVNNAGTNITEPALDVSEESWDRVQNTNLKGTFFVSQTVGRRWISDGVAGAIVNIASQAGLVAIDLRAAYCSSKAGVINLTRELALEWAAQGIRVNAVAPTFVRTPLTEPMLADEAFNRKVISMIPLGKVATPDEVAAAVLFLASNAASCITGHTLVVDGGWTIH